MQKNTVCLTMEDAKQIYELFNACALADLHYHTCHSMPCLTPLTLFGQD